MPELSQPEFIWMNGAIRPWAAAQVHVWTEVVLRAASVFEGLRGYWVPQESRHYFVHLDAHVRRLAESAKVTRIPMAMDASGLMKALSELTLALGYREDIYARPTVFLEKGRYTASTSVADTGFFMPIFPSPRERSIETGQRCQVSTWRRTSDDSAPPRVKAAANYYNLRLARLEADVNGFDEAILLNQNGKLAETGGASVFVVRDGRVITPSTAGSILDSLTRRSAMELLAADFGVTVEVRDVDRTELYVADEVFLAGTLCEITPVVQVDRLPVGSEKPGPITRSLQAAYHAACRAGRADLRGWLTAGPVLGG